MYGNILGVLSLKRSLADTEDTLIFVSFHPVWPVSWFSLRRAVRTHWERYMLCEQYPLFLERVESKRGSCIEMNVRKIQTSNRNRTFADFPSFLSLFSFCFYMRNECEVNVGVVTHGRLAEIGVLTWDPPDKARFELYSRLDWASREGDWKRPLTASPGGSKGAWWKEGKGVDDSLGCEEGEVEGDSQSSAFYVGRSDGVAHLEFSRRLGWEIQNIPAQKCCHSLR